MTQPGSQILIRAGIPGDPDLSVEGGRPYPDTAIDLVKVIHERGLTVSFEDGRDERKYVEHKAADVFLPFLEVAVDVLSGIGASLYTMLIVDLLGLDRAKESVLHVKYRIVDRRGRAEEFEASGPGTEVLEALEQFEQRVRGK